MLKTARLALLGTVLALLSCATLAQSPESTPVTFSIERQPIQKALNDWAQQAKLQLIWPAGGHEAQQLSPRVVGRFLPHEALQMLLRGSTLEATTVDARTVEIHPTNPAAAKRIAWQRPDIAPTEHLTQASSDLQQVAVPSREGEPLSQRNATQKQSLDEVLVTGSRLNQSATGVGAVPLTVFDRARIEQTGASNIAEVLNYLPQQSFSITEQTQFAGAQSAQLRGLGFGTTLVLINGRRTVTSALQGARNFFDLNTVPVSMVERIDVLADSASAVYGTDAVGGVINIVLRQPDSAPNVNLYYGGSDGGADERRATVTAGYQASRFEGSIALDWFDRNPLFGFDRDRYLDADFRRFGSSDRRSTTSNPGNISSRTSSNLPGLPSTFAAVPIGSTGIGLTPSDFAATAGTRNLGSPNAYQSVVPEATRKSVLGQLKFAVTDNSSLFGEILYADRTDIQSALPPTLSGAVVPANNPFNPFGVPVAATYLFEEIGAQTTSASADSLRIVGGMRGMVRSMDWELAALHMNEDGTGVRYSLLDNTNVTAALAATDPAQALNLFRDGPAGTPTLLASLLATPVTDSYSSQADQVTITARAPLLTLPSGEIDGVIGGEWRREDLLFHSRAANLLVDEDRETSAAFTEVRVPLLSSREPSGAARLVATVAARYDDYSDSGSTFNPQYTLSWQALGNLQLRAGYGTSFRAPSLFELNQPPTLLPTIVLDPLRGNDSTPITVSSGGNKNLRPEESDSVVLGALFTSPRFGGLKIALNYWSIDQKLRVQRLTSNLILANELSFPGRVVRSAPTAEDIAAGRPGRLTAINATSINFGRLEARGLDVEVAAALHTSIGAFSPSFMATWVDRYSAADFPQTPAVDRVGVANSQGTIPRFRATSTVAWSYGGFGVSASARYISGYDDATALNARNGLTVDSQTLIDLQAWADISRFTQQSKWLNDFVIRVGLINAFNEEAPFSEVGGAVGRDPSLSDLRERYAYVSVTKQF